MTPLQRSQKFLIPAAHIDNLLASWVFSGRSDSAKDKHCSCDTLYQQRTREGQGVEQSEAHAQLSTNAKPVA